MAKWLLPSGYFGLYFGNDGSPSGYISGATTLEFFLNGTITDSPSSFIYGNFSTAVTLSGFITALNQPPAGRTDTHRGPAKKIGVMGRLAIERPLADLESEIVISIDGLSSETVSLYAEGVDGTKIADVPIYHLRSGKKVIGSAIQNGVYVIRPDDLKWTWDNIAFLKSGNSDRVGLTIESPFDYVESPAT